MHGLIYNKPFLIVGSIIDSVSFCDIVSDVELESVVSPRDEDEFALLSIEGKMSHVKRTVSLGDSGKHPQYITFVIHYRISIHEVLETVISAKYKVDKMHVR